MSGIVGHRGLLLAPAGAPPAAVTFDPANKGPDLTLSGGNLTLTRDGTNNLAWRTCMATQGYSSGKYVYAATETVAGTAAWMTGLCEAGFGLSNYPGATATSYGLHAAGGAAYNNGATVGSALGTFSGSAIYAVDFTAGKIWIGQNGTWDGNPAAGTGERFTFTPGLTLFPAVGAYGSGQQVGGKFASTDYPYSPPSGFATWGT